MNRTERITYTELALPAELDPVIRTVLFKEDEWEEQFISNPDVDPLNVHKPYGLVIPALVKGDWTIGFSAAHFVKPFSEDYSDDTRLGDWTAYWAYHLFLHLVAADFAVLLQERVTMAETESRVEQMFRAQEPALYSFGGQIRMLNPQ